MLLTEKEARSLTDKILSFVKADDAYVSVSSNRVSHLRFARNAFSTSGSTTGRSASITVWKEGKRGSSSVSDFNGEMLKAMVEQAERVAGISPVDREYLPTLGPQEYKPVDAFAASTANVSYSTRAERIGRILRRSQKSGVISAGFHRTRARANAFATKNDNFGYEKDTVASLSVTARTKDGSSSGYFQRSHFDLDRLDTERIARESIRKCLDGRKSRALDPGAYNVILEPQAVGDLLGRFAFQLNARSAEEGRSPFSASGGKTLVGQRLFDKRLNILSDPTDPQLPGSAAAQDGIPSEKLFFVRNGVLENLIYSRYWAKRGKKNATPGPVNMILRSSGPAARLSDMIAATKTGLLISRFWYIRSTDPKTASVTGLTRDGVWLIEDGKVGHAVNNFRFNQSLTRMLEAGNVQAIGTPERIGNSNSSLFPALRLRSFNFTSRSEAV